MNFGGNGSTPGKRRIMVVVDPSREAAGALQWALSHAVLEHDELILLHVEQISSFRKSSTFSTYFKRTSTINNHSGAALTASSSLDETVEADFVEGMKSKCETMQPKVKVQVERVQTDAKENKAAAILSQSTLLGIDLLIIGQRKTSSILSKLGANNAGKDIAEFLIEHSKCLCVGVQKKGQNAGYLLNTKTHKNFWLLA